MPAKPGLSLVASSILSTAPGDGVGRRDDDAVSRRRLRPHIVALIALLELYAEQPTDELAANIASHLVTLADSPEAKPLVDAVRGYYGHANVWVDVSENLLDTAVEGSIDRWDPIDTIILGTPVAGKGKVEAVRTLEIQPGANAAVLKIVVDGVINGNTVGRRGAAEIISHTLTRFRTEKSLVLSPTGLTLLPTVCEARTQTIESSVTAKKPGLRGRILERVARRRSQELRSAADDESSQHARGRLLKAVDDEAETLVKRINRVAVLPMLLIGYATGGGQIEIYSERRVLRIGAIVGPLGAP
ncbi:MAG TPA: hypothetical protein VFI31_15915, partial [Pirellulales bacterium]|nr:hypothetical protein [Pirellulales bacterium]